MGDSLRGSEGERLPWILDGPSSQLAHQLFGEDGFGSKRRRARLGEGSLSSVGPGGQKIGR